MLHHTCTCTEKRISFMRKQNDYKVKVSVVLNKSMWVVKNKIPTNF